MLFNSLTFIVFFAVVVGSYWCLQSWDSKKNLLLGASYCFYGAWNPPFAALLLATTSMDFWLGERIHEANTKGARKVWMWASVTVNLSMLGFFKYGNFLLENLQAVLAGVGVHYMPPHLDILLPVGISFYTFHSLSYTLDVYRGVIIPTTSFRDFVLAVSFFPQLVAGPIVRAADFLPQCEEAPKADMRRFYWGLLLVTAGLFEKVVLADTLLTASADTVFSHKGPLNGLDAWTGVLAFSGQIFFDFAGYSMCAIGTALCMGFGLKNNFRSPYAARGFSDFWQRWHISLSTFLRDFLYIPLGGNRVGRVRQAVNLVIVMFIGGLWHGAAWTFVAWGLLHGAYLVMERVLVGVFGAASWSGSWLAKFVITLLTFGAVSIAWVFFRASNFGDAWNLLQSLAGMAPQGELVLGTRSIVQVLLVVAGMLTIHACLRNISLEDAVARLPAWLLTGTWAAMLVAIIITQGNSNAFIYFQF